MATLKQRLHRKNGSSYDIVHLETESNVVMRPSGNTVETDLTNYLPKVQNSDDVPEGLNPGQVSIGPTKGYYCTGDGSVKEFGKGSGGGIPTLGVDFTYTGTCTVIDDSEGENINWRIKFLTSGIFKVNNQSSIDLFMVGGGSSGQDGNNSDNGGTGGGSGYTKTEKGIVLSPNTDYQIIIGDGGASTNASSSPSSNPGGDSSAFNFSVDGGGKVRCWNGGSGGGVGSQTKSNGSTIEAGAGGSDGSDGIKNSSNWTGGTGQGTTTREFGEATGDLYAGGGGGGGGYLSGHSSSGAYGGDGGGGSGAWINGYAGARPGIYGGQAAAGETNTGSGGGGGAYHTGSNSNLYIPSGAGGSGIIVIRNKRS